MKHLLLALAMLGFQSLASAAPSLPSGSYLDTCKDARLRGSILVATCESLNHYDVTTRLFVGTCNGEIANMNGELVCTSTSPAIPRGSHVRSCRNQRLFGNSMSASCQDVNGIYRPTTLDLSLCGYQAEVSNADGHLQCIED